MSLKTHPNCIKMFDSRIFLWAVVRSHMYSIIQLPEAFFPRVVCVALVGSYEFKLTGRRMQQWHIIFEYRLIQTFPGKYEFKIILV